ncbi:MAG: glycosyltransferase family 4 protein [Candidatus Gastranaerophilales bacterium]|nr:glycosyltransferase family 4 protein [Candidatus Gastranaerophilales bacterium]
MVLKIAVIGTRGLPATYGGIEKHCEELYSGLVKKGHAVTVYSRKYYTKHNEFNGIILKSFSVPNIKGLETFIYSFIATLYATFSDADIIHYHAQGPAIFSWIPRLLTPKKKVIFTCHGIDWQRDKWNFIARNIIKLGEKASSRFPHFKIGVSQSLVDYYKNKYNIKMHKIYNGIKIPQTQPLIKGKENFGLKENDYFLFVGRLVPEKAPEILIKIFKNLKTDKKLVIVGDSAGTDDYVSGLKNLAKDDDRIIFTSYLYGDDLNELYSNAFAYISASKLEGLPITVLEAMSYSRPLILSDILPHVEPVSYNNKSGLIFKTNDTDDCRNKIELLLSMTEKEVISMGSASKNIVKEHFIWENIVNQTEQLYLHEK